MSFNKTLALQIIMIISSLGVTVALVVLGMAFDQWWLLPLALVVLLLDIIMALFFYPCMMPPQ